jgi:hypothetical protein
MLYTAPEFVNVYGAQESIPPAYVAWRTGASNRVVVPARQAGNQFLGSLKGLTHEMDLAFDDMYG